MPPSFKLLLSLQDGTNQLLSSNFLNLWNEMSTQQACLGLIWANFGTTETDADFQSQLWAKHWLLCGVRPFIAHLEDIT